MSKNFIYTAGFNTIEILIVLAMLSLLAAASLPSYRQYLLTAKLGQAVDTAASIQLLIENDLLEPDIAQSDLSSASGGLYHNHQILTAHGVVSTIAINSATITITGDSSQLYNYTIVLTFTPTVTNGRIVSWRCTTTSDVLDIVPKVCQNV